MLIFLFLLLLLLNEHEFPLGRINKGTSLCLSLSISSSMLWDYKMCIRVPTRQKLFSCIAEDSFFFFFALQCSIYAQYIVFTVYSQSELSCHLPPWRRATSLSHTSEQRVIWKDLSCFFLESTCQDGTFQQS